jgi:hypothetical protein
MFLSSMPFSNIKLPDRRGKTLFAAGLQRRGTPCEGRKMAAQIAELTTQSMDSGRYGRVAQTCQPKKFVGSIVNLSAAKTEQIPW